MKRYAVLDTNVIVSALLKWNSVPKDIVFYSIALAHGRTAETHLVTGNIKHFPENPIVVTPRQMLDILLNENERMVTELKLKRAIEEGERSAEQKGWMTVNDVRKKNEV